MKLGKTLGVLMSCAALLIDPLGLHAQQADSAFGEVLEVRVTNVDVVATDAKGSPVAGLTRDDFEVFEEGKVQEITNFYEVTGASAASRLQDGSAQAGPRPSSSARKFIFYVDNSTLSVRNRNEIFPAVTQFLAANMAPGDQTMIVAWKGSLQIRQPWTSDRAAVESTLKAMSTEVAGGAGLLAERQRVDRMLSDLAELSEPGSNPMGSKPIAVTFEMLEGNVRSHAENVRHDTAQSVGAMTKLLSSLSGVDGRKVLLMATESLPTQAGASLFESMETIRARVAMSSTSTMARSARTSSRVGDLGKYSVTPMIESLARAANATGVTIYAINPKAYNNQSSGKVELQQPGNVRMDFADSVQSVDGVTILANWTGGRAMIGAPAALVLENLGRDLSSYYSIGYRAKPGTSVERKLEVRSKRKGIAIRSRSSIYYRSLQTEVADRVLANHLQNDLANELGVTLEADAVTTDGSRKLMPMRVIIPAERLTLLPDSDGNMAGGFSVFTSTGDSSGATSGVDIQSHQLRVPEAQAAQRTGRNMTFVVQVPMDQDPKQISVGVVDHLSQTQGYATIKLAPK